MNATLSDPSTWRPTGETAEGRFRDVALLGSAPMCGFGYGIVFTLYCLCANKLWAQIRSRTRSRRPPIMLVYLTVLLLLGALYLTSAVEFAAGGFVNFRNFPGGPTAYTVYTFSSRITQFSVIAHFVTHWVTDTMLIWRVYVLYSAKRYPWAVALFPFTLWLASIAMSLGIIIENSQPNGSLWTPAAAHFVVAYYSLTASLTIICTVLLTIRLLGARKLYIQATGFASHATQYLSLAAVFIESSALYAIWSIIFLGLFVVDHPIQNVFLVTLAETGIIAVCLIIYRLSVDKAYKPGTEVDFSTLAATNVEQGLKSERALDTKSQSS